MISPLTRWLWPAITSWLIWMRTPGWEFTRQIRRENRRCYANPKREGWEIKDTLLSVWLRGTESVPLSLHLQLYRPEADLSRIFLPGGTGTPLGWGVCNTLLSSMKPFRTTPAGTTAPAVASTEMIFVMLRRKLVTLR